MVSFCFVVFMETMNLKRVLKYFLPPVCPSCRNKLVGPIEFCSDCIAKLSFISGIRCKCCGGVLDTVLGLCKKCLREDDYLWENSISILVMNKFTSKLIQRYKYNNEIELASAFSSLVKNILPVINPLPDFIVPIPIHKIKYLHRGFNQVSLVIKNAVRDYDIKYNNCLIRRKYTTSQTKLSAEERRNNLKNVFCIKDKANIKNKAILLCDDVFTTGSTLRAASEALLNAGALKVNIMSIARK